MAILQSTTTQMGLVGVTPRVVYIYTNDTEATVVTTGYLNQEQANNSGYSDADMALVTTKTSPGASDVSVGWYQVNHSGANWSLTPTSGAGNVVLPTIANHIATYTNTTGGLSEDPATAISGGNIQAGLSGTAGYLASFPATASKGSLRIVGVANTGNTVTTISNAAMGQASTYVFPDPGVATAHPIVDNIVGATQTIQGQLLVTTSFTASTGPITSGQAGTAGTFIAFPATAANGTMIIAAGNAGGAFNTTVTSGTIGQSTVYTIPDIGASTGGVVVSTAAVRMKSVAAAVAAGGAAAQSFTDTFCTSGSNVIGNWNTQTNPASVLKIVPGNGSFVVTSSVDAGSGTFNYVITK